MFPPNPQHIRLVEVLDDYVQAYDTADWHVVLDDLKDPSGQPLDFTGATLHMQIRPVTLPGQVVDDLKTGSGITASGSTVTIISARIGRSWRARETTVLIADLMSERVEGTATTIAFVKRIHFVIEAGATNPSQPPPP